MRKRTMVLAAALTSLVGASCGAQSNRSSQIASEIGGQCGQTRYDIIYRVAKTRARIYDCTVSGKRMCVTEQNGIASDQTALARVLFANALSGGKPGCIGGG